MTVNYPFGDVFEHAEAHGATLRARAASLQTEHQAREAVARGQKLQTAAGNVAGADIAVGSSWG